MPPQQLKPLLAVAALLPLFPPCLQAVLGKFNAVGALLQQTHVAQLLSTLDDGPVMGALMGKVNTARDMLKKAVPAVAATDGN
jgi:hypothetical protein